MRILSFVRWYKAENRYSAINFVLPNQCQTKEITSTEKPKEAAYVNQSTNLTTPTSVYLSVDLFRSRVHIRILNRQQKTMQL